ncbi:hypothetical protein [Halobaculum roseum]|uniref:Uncharacterized protein n=1 Tax=Halobaculum roseum TaxID=2175149 RepID=A0ABD5MQF2_9EURY|nr:hypothetical protein [Halobaculum roseum]QZY04520.1 hypothetical protein K6T36_17790 [Halobaculum roseum]
MSQIPQQQPGQYGTESSVSTSQQSQFGQQPQYGQQSQFGQQPQFGQQGQFGQQPQFGQQAQPSYQIPQGQSPPMQTQLPAVSQGSQQAGSPSQQVAQADGRQIATALQELERTLDQANVYALENGNSAVARITEDLETMIEAERKLILRRSPFAESFRQTVAQNLQQALQELHQQPNDPAHQELIAQIQQASTALQNGSVQMSPSAQGQQSQLGHQSTQSQHPQK